MNKLAMKVLATRTLAVRVNYLLFQLCKLFQAFFKEASKLFSDKSPRPRKAPKYFTGLELILTPAIL